MRGSTLRWYCAQNMAWAGDLELPKEERKKRRGYGLSAPRSMMYKVHSSLFQCDVLFLYYVWHSHSHYEACTSASVNHRTAQHSTAQHSAALSCTAQHSIV